MTDAEDNMSDELLANPSGVRPSPINAGSKKRQKISRRQRQAEFDEALQTPLTAENKGFQMLVKMGYKAGQALGKPMSGNDESVTNMANKRIVEPIPMSIKLGRHGLGRKLPLRGKRRQLRKERMRGAAGLEKNFIQGASISRQLTCENMEQAAEEEEELSVGQHEVQQAEEYTNNSMKGSSKTSVKISAQISKYNAALKIVDSLEKKATLTIKQAERLLWAKNMIQKSHEPFVSSTRDNFERMECIADLAQAEAVDVEKIAEKALQAAKRKANRKANKEKRKQRKQEKKRKRADILAAKSTSESGACHSKINRTERRTRNPRTLPNCKNRKQPKPQNSPSLAKPQGIQISGVQSERPSADPKNTESQQPSG